MSQNSNYNLITPPYKSEVKPRRIIIRITGSKLVEQQKEIERLKSIIKKLKQTK